jgi:dCMP deaminase
MGRVSWHQYFMEIAYQVSTRATCDRLHVGAVIVKDKQILATGYNGSISGLEHCDDVGHLMVDEHCVRTVHAESNAIAQAAKRGVSVDEAIMYVTHSPCINCFKLCASAGIKKIVFGKFYKDELVVELANQANIELIDMQTT